MGRVPGVRGLRLGLGGLLRHSNVDVDEVSRPGTTSGRGKPEAAVITIIAVVSPTGTKCGNERRVDLRCRAGGGGGRSFVSRKIFPFLTLVVKRLMDDTQTVDRFLRERC